MGRGVPTAPVFSRHLMKTKQNGLKKRLMGGAGRGPTRYGAVSHNKSEWEGV
jgi:hypothetical protein